MFYTSYTSTEPGRWIAAHTSPSHNAALYAARKLFAGNGYRAVREESRSGHLVLRSKKWGEAVIKVIETDANPEMLIHGEYPEMVVYGEYLDA